MENQITKLGKQITQKNITVCFVRHGTYYSYEDLKRGNLNPYGISKTKELCKYLKDFAGEKQIILWTSSVMRAVQSAEIISENLKNETFNGVFVEKRVLHNDAEPGCKDLFDDCEEGSFVIIVSHEPTIKFIGFEILGRGYGTGYSEAQIIYPNLSRKVIFKHVEKEWVVIEEKPLNLLLKKNH